MKTNLGIAEKSIPRVIGDGGVVRLVRLIGFGVVVIVVAISTFFIWQARRWERGFDKIQAGDSCE